MKKTRKACVSVSLQIKTVFKRQLSNAAIASDLIIHKHKERLSLSQNHEKRSET
jgi:hypothetical protein